MSPEENDRVQLAVVGCGRWGQNLLRTFSRLPAAHVVACCNKDNQDRLDDMRSVYPGIRTGHNLSEILGDDRVRAVVVATPDRTHVEIATAAIEAGKHVFVEKPLAPSLTEAIRLVQLAEARGRVLMVGHIVLYHPAIKWLKKRIGAGMMNPVSILSTRIEFGITRDDADLLRSSVVHDIAVIQFLLESEPDEVNAVGASLTPGGPYDMLFVNLRFQRDIAAHVCAGFAGPYKERRLVVHSPTGIVVFDGVTGGAHLFADNGSRSSSPSGNRDYAKWFDEGVLPEMGQVHDPLTAECDHFVDCIRRGTAPLSGGRSALAVARTLDRIARTLAKSDTTRVGTGS